MPQLDHFDTTLLPPKIIQVVESALMPELDFRPSNPGIVAIVAENWSSHGKETVWMLSAQQSKVLKAALLLLAGDLEKSHNISQDMHDCTGSFWHGVMHRREGDFGNAKYWFRQAGPLGFYDQLLGAIRQDPLTNDLIHGSVWDAVGFVDRCQAAVRQGGDLRQQCMRAQWIEWQIALAACLTRIETVGSV